MLDVLNKVPRYGLVRDWLGLEMTDRLLKYADCNQKYFIDAKVFSKEAIERIDQRRRISRKLPSISDVDLDSSLRSKLKDTLPIIFDQLGTSQAVSSSFERELVAHGNGAFFECHSDTGAGLSQSRLISAVYYFHAMPKSFSGGMLRIHSLGASGREGTFVDIKPCNDTLVFFPSFFPHEVLPVECNSGKFLDSRFAVNFWIHGHSAGSPGPKFEE